MGNVKPKLLYVDDEPFNLTLFKALFKKSFDLLVAESADKGIELFQNHPEVNVVVSDMRMPKMNGVQFVKRIKSISENIPCFILTGFNESEDLNEAVKQKLIVKTFHKPLDKEQIENSIISYLNN
jgi:response regulator RpfG family c-di-GMP phosphodiesterase